MIKRLNISIFSPSKIAFFLKDKKRYVLAYLLLLSFIISIPLMIQLAVSSGMSDGELKTISKQLKDQSLVCSITDYKLDSNCQSDAFEIGPFNMAVNNIESSGSNYLLVLKESGISLYFLGREITNVSYEVLKIDNLDLSLSNEVEQQKFEQVVTDLYDQTKTARNVMMVLVSTASEFILFVLLAILIAFVYGMMPQRLKYQYRFVMASYALTPYIVLLLIATLYGFEELLFLGLILPYIYMRIAYTGLLKMSRIVIKKEE